MKFSRGFTLVELLMGLAILSIVTTTVVPSFSQLLAEQRLRQVSNELRMSLTLARSEAIKRNQTVNVLPAESAWSDGWCVESDTAASCTNSSLGAYVVPKKHCRDRRVLVAPVLPLIPGVARLTALSLR